MRSRGSLLARGSLKAAAVAAPAPFDGFTRNPWVLGLPPTQAATPVKRGMMSRPYVSRTSSWPCVMR
jgi:hypothetical protein